MNKLQWQAQVNANAATLDKQFQGMNRGAPGGDWGGAYIKYMALHPNADPNTIFNAVETALQRAEHNLAALPKSIADAIAAVGKATGQTVPGLTQLNPVKDLFHGLDLGNWILRIGEITLGIVLIAVGLAHLTGVDNVIAKAARSAGAVAML